MLNLRRATLLLLVAALALFAACSDDDPVTPEPDPTVTETIGAAGGQLAMTDMLELDIPANALDADVEFVAAVESAPPALPDGWVAVTPCLAITPHGTVFAAPAELTFHYDPADVPQFVDGKVLDLWTHDGTDWTDLARVYDSEAHTLTVQLDHLSWFIIVSPEPEPPADVHLEFEIERELYGDPQGAEFSGYDTLSAEFEASSPSKIEGYLEAGEVTYGPWALELVRGYYHYSSDADPMFLDLATNYDLVVEGSLDVTPMTIPVATMAGVPVITNVTDGGELPLEGFEITWDGASQGGSVEIYLDPDGGDGLFRTADNTGSYTFTETTLNPLSAGSGTIRLVWLYETPIDRDGYLGSSRTKYRTEHTIDVTFTGGGGGQLLERMESRMPNLAIPDATSSGYGNPVTDVINMPITGVVDSVRVYLDISHTWMSDLICKLTSPDGTQLRVLFIGEGGEVDGRTQGWYPDDFTPKDDLNGFDGESAGGNWTLECRDYSQGAAGVLNQWRLQVFYR